MDLMYMDVMAYQSIRNPRYDKYAWEPPANNNESKAKQATQKKKVKEPCKICQERQRRSLMKYIRSKSHDHSEQNIQEEDEEEEEEKQGQAEKTQQKEETQR